MSEPEWLSPDTVVALNELIVNATGEPFQLRDEGLLEGALGRIYDHWAYGGETDVVNLATMLIFAIAKNHPFAQGNKRTGFEAAILFLQQNGYDWTAPDDVDFAELMIAVIEGEAELMDFANEFEIHVIAASDHDEAGDSFFSPEEH